MADTTAAIIGSGFGGLAAAIRLQAAGLTTVLFEARDKPGGRAYVYEKDGFTFDGGPTVITAPHCLEDLFELGGEKMADHVKLLPVRPFYRLAWQDGDTMDWDGDADHMRAQLAARRPEDAEGYTRFLAYSDEVFRIGYEQMVATPFLNFSDMVRATPHLARLRADRSVYGTVSRFVKDEHVRQALSFHALLVGGNPFETSSVYTLIHSLERRWGVHFPRGGTGALVRALVGLYQRLGGTIRLSSPVERVEVREQGGQTIHRVHSRHGAEDFQLVVSNADLHHTYDRLYRSHASAPSTVKRLTRMRWSMSLFVLYFGTNRQYRDLAHHTVLFGPRYRELLAEVFGGRDLPEDFSLYLHAPGVTDPTLAPPGCDSFYVLSPVPHLGHAPLNWSVEGPRYAERILESLERYMPDLRRHVVTQHWISPEQFQSDLGAYHGSAFSVAPTLTQSAWFRPHNRDSRIPGLYIVGAGTHPGAGVPGVVNSAKATADVILKDLQRQARRKAA